MTRWALEERDAWRGDEWEDLFLSSPWATPFQSPEWQLAWFSELAPRARPAALALREGDDLVGWLPLARLWRGCRVARASGLGVSDYLHPLVRAGYERAFEDAVRELEASGAFDVVEVGPVREDCPLGDLTTGPPEATCLVLALPPTYEAYLAGLSKSLRYDCRGPGRSSFPSGARVRFATTPDEALAGLEALFRLHGSRWRRRGLPGVFSSRRVRRFHRAYAAWAVRNDRLRLVVLEVDETPVGAVYAMRAGGACFFYQSGFDAGFGRLSPGAVLVSTSIRRAIEEGLGTFDFLRGDEPYKRRWKPQRVLVNRRHVWSSGGVASSAWARLGWWRADAERLVKARFEGRGLLPGYKDRSGA
jgi:CelD/BcsL family acetyltransferase involved in cellulose biosynthesis